MRILTPPRSEANITRRRLRAQETLDQMRLLMIFTKLKYLYSFVENAEDLKYLRQLHFDILWLQKKVPDPRLLRVLIWETIQRSSPTPTQLRYSQFLLR